MITLIQSKWCQRYIHEKGCVLPVIKHLLLGLVRAHPPPLPSCTGRPVSAPSLAPKTALHSKVLHIQRSFLPCCCAPSSVHGLIGTRLPHQLQPPRPLRFPQSHCHPRSGPFLPRAHTAEVRWSSASAPCSGSPCGSSLGKASQLALTAPPAHRNPQHKPCALPIQTLLAFPPLFWNALLTSPLAPLDISPNIASTGVPVLAFRTSHHRSGHHEPLLYSVAHSCQILV